MVVIVGRHVALTVSGLWGRSGMHTDLGASENRGP